MSTVESKIDDLYQLPLNDFIPARSALAAEFKGDEGRRVKALKKPTLAPWAVNQVYWHARSIFDRVRESGAGLRTAQIAALEGRQADVHGAADAHRKAIGAAVERAMALGQAARLNPDRDAVARTFEALSIAAEPPEPPGRLTQPLQPGGFELLAGVEPVVKAPPAGAPAPGGSRPTTSRRVPARETSDPPAPAPGKAAKAATGQPSARERAAAEARAAADRARERERAAAARRHDAAIARLEREVARAREQAAQARLAWDRATDEVSAAERRLSEARRPRPV
ncbi:MAG: hypothetical protein ABI868_06780 [Acidobacteriota bacterium]